MKVLYIPESLNPYHALLSSGLARHGVEVSEGRLPGSAWLLRNRQEIDIFHFHWPHVCYTVKTSAWKTLILAALFVQRLILAWILGYKIVWTIHNLSPHDQIFPKIDKAVQMAIVVFAKALIAHCEFARKEFASQYRRKRGIFVIPIGNYDIYPGEISKVEAKKTLGIEQYRLIYLYFGVIRPYKGVEELLSSFTELSSEEVCLLVVGNCRDQGLCRNIKSVAKQDARIHLHLEWVPDDQVQYYLASCDVVVAPFQNILTSSSVMLGMSLAKPVIVPASGCLPELVRPDCGILYDPKDPIGLSNALKKASQVNLEEMGQQAHRVSHAFDWDNIGEQTFQVYNYCLGRRLDPR